MKRKIKEVADLAGVSVRTLHHYDEIGLLSPDTTTEAGYRLYSEKNLEVLQQILFFRELDFPLKKIKEIINSPDFDRYQVMLQQRDQLLEKRYRLDQIIIAINKTIQHMKGEMEMTTEGKFEAFKERMLEDNEQKYGKEIREKYGEETVETSNAKWRGMSQQDYQAMLRLEQELFELLEQAYATGDPGSDLAQAAAAKHKEWLMYSWSEYSKEAHAGLAEMYVTDERFTAYYDKHVKDGTVFLRDAILIYTGKKES
ncbi:MerR family transcriptional regulator [Gracilibacillus alcaliphilus]|uniref:MerR family transcriptional regulator n=1 Tax=Gracilibacillus alcaliphilus TaxID=1401441 RepID=UPI00195A385A|nr:MerR family transcriptional regulator [Gracilibacillus alcaliphilus]MBM7676218.1 DNA-binding transcriptional MerR regulator [Gracilibacillus alcaliphilus]